MAIVLYKKQDPNRSKPFEALYIAFFLLSLLTINTYYLVFFEVHYRYILWAFLAIGYMISIYANMNLRTYIDLLINLLALAFFVIYFRMILDNIDNFGSIFGQLLAVLLVLRSYVLFNREDFFVSLVVSLVIMLLCSIPSYESNFVISLQAYFFILVACLYLLSKSKEMDEVRQGFYELEKVQKRFKMTAEAKMLFSLGFISLMLATAVYLAIPHQQGGVRGYTSQLRKLLGYADNYEAQAQKANETEQNKLKSKENETYVGFNQDNFTIASGKTIREGENANDIVMQVQMDYPRYMRAMVWDIYQNGEWKRSGELENDWVVFEKDIQKNEILRTRDNPEYDLNKPREITVPELKQNRVEFNGRVFLTKGYNPSSFLFLPWETTRLKIDSEDIRTNESSEVKLKTSTGKSPNRVFSSYMFSAKSYLPSGMEATYLRQKPSGHFLERYTQLPESALEPNNSRTVKEFADEIVKKANAATDYEKTLAIFKYLKSAGKYSNDVPAVEPGMDLISYFILEVEPMRGHCEIFSSSMAVMLRALDIPCRIATGYSPGNYAFNKNSYIIREKHAHAWVEVFFPEIGWIEFDPTP
ncbi:transglutaminase-like domain-containing protein, partial [bacterium]|nr:transglutaminase-like domain-containing protein [bacterium]MBU1024977.1 transglutaminase-like domain-containing protein [bacterium]